jgi:hypothetical protein
MTRFRHRICIAVAILFVVSMGYVAQRHYYEEYSWPNDIQEHLFGQVVVSHDELLSRQGFSHMGQGAFRWDYRITRTNAIIQSLCDSNPVDKCSWSKHADVAAHVSLDAVFHNSVLTLEESWL